MSLLRELRTDVASARACISALRRSREKALRRRGLEDDAEEAPSVVRLPSHHACSTDCLAVVQTMMPSRSEEKTSEHADVSLAQVLQGGEEFESLLCELLHGLREQHAGAYADRHSVQSDDRMHMLESDTMSTDTNAVAEWEAHALQFQHAVARHSTGSQPGPRLASHPAPPAAVDPTYNSTRAGNGGSSQFSMSSADSSFATATTSAAARSRRHRGVRGSGEDWSGASPAEDDGLQFDSAGRPVLPASYMRARAAEEAATRRREDLARNGPATLSVNHPFATKSFTTAAGAPRPLATMRTVNTSALSQQSSLLPSSRFPALARAPKAPPPPMANQKPSNVSLPWLVREGEDESTHFADTAAPPSLPLPDLSALCQAYLASQIPRAWTRCVDVRASGDAVALAAPPSTNRPRVSLRRRECVLASLLLLGDALVSLGRVASTERAKARAALAAHACADLRVRALEVEAETNGSADRHAELESRLTAETIKREQLEQTIETVQAQTLLLRQQLADAQAKLVQATPPTPPTPTIAVAPTVPTPPPVLAPAPVFVTVAPNADLLAARGRIAELEKEVSTLRTASTAHASDSAKLRAQLSELTTREADARREIRDLHSQLEKRPLLVPSPPPQPQQPQPLNDPPQTKLKPSPPHPKKKQMPTPSVSDAPAPVVATTTAAPAGDAQAQAQALALEKAERRIKALTSQVSSLQADARSAQTAASSAATKLTSLEAEMAGAAERAAAKQRQTMSKLTDALRQVELLTQAAATAKIEAVEPPAPKPKKVKKAPKKTKKKAPSSTKEKTTNDQSDGDDDDPATTTDGGAETSRDTAAAVAAASAQADLFARLQSQYDVLEARYAQLQTERAQSADRHASELAAASKAASQSTGVAASTEVQRLQADHTRQRESAELARAKLESRIRSLEDEASRIRSERAVEANKHAEEATMLREQVARLQNRMQQMAAAPPKPNTSAAEDTHTEADATAPVAAPSDTSAAKLASLLVDHAGLKKRFNALHHQCSEALRKLKVFEANCQCDALKDQQSKMRRAILEAFRTD